MWRMPGCILAGVPSDQERGRLGIERVRVYPLIGPGACRSSGNFTKGMDL